MYQPVTKRDREAAEKKRQQARLKLVQGKANHLKKREQCYLLDGWSPLCMVLRPDQIEWMNEAWTSYVITVLFQMFKFSDLITTDYQQNV